MADSKQSEQKEEHKRVINESITKIISNQLGQFTLELNSVWRKIQNRKADGISSEIWKSRELNNILLQHCNATYKWNTIERLTKGYILPFPKKGDLRIAKNYHSITLTSIGAKIYNALICNDTEPKIDRILRENQNGFQRNWSTTWQMLTIHQILEGVCAKNLDTTILLVNFSKAFDSLHRGKIEQILLTYGFPIETVTAIMMLHLSDGDTDYFNIVAGVLQEDILAPYLFIICIDYMLKMSIDKMKDNSFKLVKERSRRYPA